MSLLLTTENLTKKYGEFYANREVSISIQKNSMHAVLGENGAGKSTLLKLLFGLERPTSGQFFFNQKPVQLSSVNDAISMGMGMVQQHFCLVENKTAVENIFLGAETTKNFLGQLDTESAIEKLEKLLPSPLLRVPWLSKIDNLSIGQKQKVEILKLIFREAKLLFLDEPTAVLTPQESAELYSVLKDLKANGHTIVIITHKIKDVLEHCDHFSVLRQGQLIGTGPTANETSETIANMMVGGSIKTDSSKHFIETNVASKILLEFKNVSTNRAKDGSEETFDSQKQGFSSMALDQLSFSLKEGQILGVAGIEGHGQDLISETVLGLLNYTGEIFFNEKSLAGLSTAEVRSLGISIVPSDRLREGLWLSENPLVNLIVGIEKDFANFYGFLSFSKMKAKLNSWLSACDVRYSHPNVRVSQMSGGNQQKLIFARELIGKTPKLLLCHHPTRGVDFASTKILHQLLFDHKNRKGSAIVVSSDLDELTDICDDVLVLYKGKIVKTFSHSEFGNSNLTDRSSALIRLGQAMTGVNS